MADTDSINDASIKVSQPASTEHDTTLHALQKEIEYHRQHDANGSYFEKAISFFHDGAADELVKLELDFKSETEKPNSLTREEVTKDLKDDQKALGWKDSSDGFLSNVANISAVIFGKKWGLLAAGLTTALDTMHPNDSFGKQALEGVYGFGLGYGTGSIAKYGLGMENRFVGLSMATLAFPLGRTFSNGKWPNGGYGEKPDLENIFTQPAPNLSLTEKTNLIDQTSVVNQPADTGNYWQQFQK